MNGIIAYGITDTGKKRSRNEDSVAVDTEHGLFVVADGMGGHTAGDMASSMAISTVSEFIKRALTDSEITWPFGIDQSVPKGINIISSGIRLANRHIFSEAKGMGTTMAVLLVQDNRAHICHVGDSRVYRIRNNIIQQITQDHSLVAEEIRRGTIDKEQAKAYALRHVITRAVGIAADIQCDHSVEDLMSGDIFLLCSDGLTGMVDDPEILDTITNSSGIKEAGEKLIQKANEKGGDDNITVILVQYN